MSSQEFWPRAWALESALNQGLPSHDVGQLNQLVDQLVLQRLLFIHHEWQRPEWFSVLREAGLFANPPEVERTEEGLRAVAWPALTYLTNVVDADPRQAAHILSQIRTENWWVVADALAAAVRLPNELASGPILGLLASYQRAPVQWTAPDLLASVLAKLGQGSVEPDVLTEAAYRIFRKLLVDSNRAYTIPEILDAGTDLIPEQLLPALGNGIEAALTAGVVRAGMRFSTFDNLDVVLSGEESQIMDEGAAHLIRSWVRIAEAEIALHGAVRGSMRATRLLSAESTMLRQMGLRVLRMSSTTADPDPDVLSSLNWVLESRLWLESALQSEMLPLVADNWVHLDSTLRMGLIRLISSDPEVSVISPYLQRNWLGALSSHIGPEGQEVLSALAERYGPPRTEFVVPRPIVEWVGPEAPFPIGEIEDMTWDDVTPFLSHAPGGSFSDGIWGPTPEGLGRALRSKVVSNPKDVISHLDVIVERAIYSGVLYSVIDGMTEGFKSEAPPKSSIPAIEAFLTKSLVRARSGELASDPEFPTEDSAITGAIAYFIEVGANWVITHFDDHVVVDLLCDISKDREPDPANEVGSEVDPVIIGLNSARGKALRACLTVLLASRESDKPMSDPLVSGLSEIVRTFATDEPSAGVRSSFGVYLPHLISGFPSLWAEIQDSVLPRTDEAITQWAAAWGSYVAFHPAYLDLSADLRIHYQMSINRRGSEAGGYVNEVFSRVINHLIALSLSGRGEEFQSITDEALSSSEDQQAAESFHGLASALAGKGTRFSMSDIVRLLERRSSQIRSQRVPRPHELSAMLGVIINSGIDLEDTGGLVIDLLRLGGSPDPDRLILYLEESDPGRSYAGAKILREASAAGSFSTWFSNVEGLRALIGVYGQRNRQLMWETVNALGAQGLFAIETEALALAPSSVHSHSPLETNPPLDE